MKIRATNAGVVDCHAAIPLRLPASSVWGQLRDFRRYASHDYFHCDLRVAGGVARRGAAIRLAHAFAGFRVERVGRILVWREGEGFAFSDLSRRGSSVGFPHVLSMRVVPAVDPTTSVLHVRVRGRWTASWVPMILHRAWLAWVFGYVISRTRNELLVYQAVRVSAPSRLW